ncbi:hypothetical protein HDU92_006096 [Lobulomyces angularis]|nr:hypothetical protein HDU92_006096 [Lobulomyces angularis]
MAIDKSIYRVFRLTDNRLIVEQPSSSTNDYDGTSIPRKNSKFLVVNENSLSVEEYPTIFDNDNVNFQLEFTCSGVIGFIQLCFTRYLLVITAKKLSATLQSHKIWKITAGAAIPINVQHPNIHDENIDEETLAKLTLDNELLESIKLIINSGNLYFSTTYDLTHSLQHSYLQTTSNKGQTIIDDRYWFNQYLQKPLLEGGLELKPWLLKVICGFTGSINFKDIPIEEDDTSVVNTFTVTLISRLSIKRLGTRYIKRGLDWEGNAANSVEMEQLCFHHDYINNKLISSYVQLRGSAPAVWKQTLDLSYRPELGIKPMTDEKVWRSIHKHLHDLKCQYIGVNENEKDNGLVICVNLLDTTGFEGDLTQNFSDAIEKFNSEKVVYEGFPIHKWCKKLNFRNMDILMNRVQDGLVNSGYFLADGDVPTLSQKKVTPMLVKQLQTGLCRVVSFIALQCIINKHKKKKSCLDSLDRTNLTCSLFAKFMIPLQINAQIKKEVYYAIPINGVTSTLDSEGSLSTIKKSMDISMKYLTNLWADSGDAISILYAGTKALKGDVTRTGKRQWIQGSLDDGVNSLTRYYLNNFSDGRKQDAYDLWSGKVTTSEMQKATEQSSTNGVSKVGHCNGTQKPIITKTKGLGYFLPPFLVDRIEPLLQATLDYTGSSLPSQIKTAKFIKTNQNSTLASLIAGVKLYAPEQVINVIEFTGKVTVFMYLLIIVKIFQINGEIIVDKQKLNLNRDQSNHEFLMTDLD